MNLQQQVQQHLQDTGISLRELSRRSGISHQAIGKILRGGTYKSDTANDLIFAMSFYGGDTARPVMQDKAAETLDATVEQLAAQRVNADLTHHADLDTDLQCAKYRRVMQLEAEAVKARVQADELKTELECSRIDVRKAEALTQVYSKDLQVMQASWKAACVQVEQLQKQLDHGQVVYSKLCSQLGATRAKYEAQLEAANQKELRLQEQLTEVYAEKTRQEAQIMRLRVYVWILICAVVFLIVSGLVVWGGV